jgi:hypothetical protein
MILPKRPCALTEGSLAPIKAVVPDEQARKHPYKKIWRLLLIMVIPSSNATSHDFD